MTEFQHAGIDAVECVDADDRIGVFGDVTGNHRHRAAARADVKHGGLGEERVLRYVRLVLNRDLKRAGWARSPDAAMLRAERAGAGARRNFVRLRQPIELE